MSGNKRKRGPQIATIKKIFNPTGTPGWLTIFVGVPILERAINIYDASEKKKDMADCLTNVNVIGYPRGVKVQLIIVKYITHCHIHTIVEEEQS